MFKNIYKEEMDAMNKYKWIINLKMESDKMVQHKAGNDDRGGQQRLQNVFLKLFNYEIIIIRKNKQNEHNKINHMAVRKYVYISIITQLSALRQKFERFNG